MTARVRVSTMGLSPPLRTHLQILEAFSIEAGRMRVQPAQHAVDRRRDQLLVVDRFDIIALDTGKYIGEGTQLLDRQRSLRILVGDRRQIECQCGASQYASQTDQYEFCLLCHLTSPSPGGLQ